MVFVNDKRGKCAIFWQKLWIKNIGNIVVLWSILLKEEDSDDSGGSSSDDGSDGGSDGDDDGNFWTTENQPNSSTHFRLRVDLVKCHTKP